MELLALLPELGQEQLAFQNEVVDDTRVRALVAETPLADREFRIASEDHQRILRMDALGAVIHRACEESNERASRSRRSSPARAARTWS